MTLAGVLPSLALAPFAVPVSKRFGKKEIGIFGCLCSAISCFLLFFLHTKSAALYIGINILGFLGFGIFNLILWAFITDVIDDQEVRTGKREMVRFMRLILLQEKSDRHLPEAWAVMRWE